MTYTERAIKALKCCHVFVGGHRHEIRIGILVCFGITTMVVMGLSPGFALFAEAALARTIEDIL